MAAVRQLRGLAPPDLAPERGVWNFDTAENEPLKVWRSLEVIYSSPPSCDSFWLAAAPSPPGAVLSADLAPEREDVLDPERVVEEPEQHAFF